MIYLVWGPPGAGKSYYATKWALEELQRRKKQKHVFSNYPIIKKRKKNVLSSYIWKPELVYENILDALVFVDESYRDYNCHNHKDFDEDTHLFFSAQRHNDNDLVLLTHNPARINLIIREITNDFIFVKAHKLLFIERPIFFTAEHYLDFEDFRNRQYYGKEIYRFTKKVGNCYDTKYFRKDGGPEYVPDLWYKPEEVEDK